VEKFEDIRITKLNPARTELRRDGSLSTGQVRFFFDLTETPPSAWTFHFQERWHEGGATEKAIFADGGFRVWCSVSDGHACAAALKKVAAATNNWFRTSLQEDKEEGRGEAKAEAALRQRVEDLAKTLKF
jgi:hypothetical protein